MPSGYRGNTIRRRPAVQSEPAASLELFPRWGPGRGQSWGRGGRGPACSVSGAGTAPRGEVGHREAGRAATGSLGRAGGSGFSSRGGGAGDVSRAGRAELGPARGGGGERAERQTRGRRRPSGAGGSAAGAVGAGGGAPGSPRASSARRRRRASPRPALHGALAPRTSPARLLPASGAASVCGASAQTEPPANLSGAERRLESPAEPPRSVARAGETRPPASPPPAPPDLAAPSARGSGRIENRAARHALCAAAPPASLFAAPEDEAAAPRSSPRGRGAGVRPSRAGSRLPHLTAAFSGSLPEGVASPAPGLKDVRPRGPPRLNHAPQRRRRAGRHGAPRGRALTRSAPRGRRAAGGGQRAAADREPETGAAGRKRAGAGAAQMAGASEI